MNGKKLILLIMIIITGGYLRLCCLDLMEFKDDESSALMLALNMVRNNDLPTAGIVSSIKLRNFPVFIWLLGIPVGISRNPITAAGFIALLNIAAIPVLFKIVRNSLDEATAYISILLYAFSPWGIIYSRKVWEQNLLAPFTIFLFYFLLKFLIGKQNWALFPAILVSGCVMQLHFSGLVVIPYLLAVLIFYGKYVPKKLLLISVLGTFMLFVPYVLYLIEGDRANLNLFFTSMAPQHGATLWKRAVQTLIAVFGNFGNNGMQNLVGNQFMRTNKWWGINSYLGWFESILFGAGLILMIKRACIHMREPDREKRHPSVELLFSYWVVLFPVGVWIMGVEPFNHYFLASYPVRYIMIGYLLGKLAASTRITKSSPSTDSGEITGHDKNRYRPKTTVLVFSILLLITISQILFISTFFSYLRIKGGVPGDYYSVYGTIYRHKRNVLAFVIGHSASQKRNFNLSHDFQMKSKLRNEYEYILEYLGSLHKIAGYPASRFIDFVLIDTSHTPLSEDTLRILSPLNRREFGPIMLFW